MKNYKKFFLILAILIVLAAIILSGASKEPARAGDGENVSGFAWSENIGWISFNSKNCDTNNDGKSEGGSGCPSEGTIIPTYGVNIDTNTGALTGFAWSENIGWIKFNPAGPYPAAPNNSATLNINTNQITGWARACVGTVNGDCNSATRTDGWDGWIKMTGFSYSVSRSNCELTGFAWGSDVIGWISFNSKNCDANNDGKSDGSLGCPSAGTSIPNYKVTTTFCNPVPLPDYIIQDSTITGDLVEGKTLSFSATVKNQGGANATVASQTRLRIDKNNDGTWDVLPANQSTDALAVNATQTATWSNAWIATAGTHKYEICADATGIITESDDNNNCVSKIFTVVPAGGGTGNICGWAWSDMTNSQDENKHPEDGLVGRGMGWISFNSTNPQILPKGSHPYGVNMDASGNLTGYAWSENLAGQNTNNNGWIRFDAGYPSDSPPGDAHSARVESDGRVTGWARACAATDPTKNDCTGNHPYAGGWDGWIKLSNSNTGSYGVQYDKNIGLFSGSAWGGYNVGWISFKGTAQDGTPYQVFRYDNGDCPATPPNLPLSVSLTADKYSGNRPLEVTLTAQVNDDHSGSTINYSFWWNCSNPSSVIGDVNKDISAGGCGVLPTPPAGECDFNQYGYKCNGITSLIQSTSLHTYNDAGDYTAKVIVERNTLSAEDRKTIKVTACPSTPNNFKATVASDCSYIDLSWDNVENNEGYQLIRESSEGNWSKTLSKDTTNYRDSDNIVYGKNYKYTLKPLYNPKVCSTPPAPAEVNTTPSCSSASSFRISPAFAIIYKGSYQSFRAYFDPDGSAGPMPEENVTGTSTTWSIESQTPSKPDGPMPIISLDSSVAGRVLAEHPGTATIKASHDHDDNPQTPELEATANITVKKLWWQEP